MHHAATALKFVRQWEVFVAIFQTLFGKMRDLFSKSVLNCNNAMQFLYNL